MSLKIEREFHADDGLYFARLEDGSVRIVKLNGQSVGFAVVVPPGIWASAVLTVSALGERPGDWQRFLDHHQGKTDLLR